VAAFELSPVHTRRDTLDDQIAFEFGDGSDDHHDGAAI